MANVADDGHGAILTLGTSAWDTTTLITNIDLDPITREILKTTHLVTSGGHTFIPEDLPDYGGFTLEFFSDGDVEPPITAVQEVTTITYPLQAAYSTASLVTGNAFCDSYTPASFEAGKLIKGSAHFKWNGAFTFTDHT